MQPLAAAVIADILPFLHLNDISVQSVPVMLFLFLHVYLTEGDSQLILGTKLQVISGVSILHTDVAQRVTVVENWLGNF